MAGPGLWYDVLFAVGHSTAGPVTSPSGDHIQRDSTRSTNKHSRRYNIFHFEKVCKRNIDDDDDDDADNGEMATTVAVDIWLPIGDDSVCIYFILLCKCQFAIKRL